jgi:ubiquinone/menaquinone biosynthesis C-methylase UbiE
MSFWHLPRIPVGELIEGEAEREAAADAALRRRLDAEDDLFVSRALRLGIELGTVLDVGTGLGLIPVKLALRNPGLVLHALDLSEDALRYAALNAAEWGVGLRILLNHGDATAMPFDDGLFDLVVCHRVLHRVSDPVALLREIGRVCRDSGAILLRDLRRPSRLAFPCFMYRTGRHYRGGMRLRYEAAVRAAFTRRELNEFVKEAGVANLRTVEMGYSGIGVERRARGGR